MRRSLTIFMAALVLPAFSIWARADVREYTLTTPAFTTQPTPGDSLAYENSALKEQIGEMPWTSRNGTIRAVFAVKDANEAWIVFDYLRLYETTAGRVLIWSYEIDTTLSSDLSLFPFDVPAGPVGTLRKFEWEFRFREYLDPFFWTVARYVDHVAVAPPLPSVTDWRRFDLHIHSFATDTEFEWGMLVREMGFALSSIGLDGAFFTDHGESLTSGRWATEVADCATFSTTTRLLRAGEEATVDDDLDNDFPDRVLHVSCYGLTRPLYTPAEYICANQGFQLWTMPQLLDSLEAQNAVCFAAHPASALEMYGYNLVPVWPDTMFSIALASPSFLGVQFYNQRITKKTDVPSASNVDPFASWIDVPNWPSQYDAGMRQYQQLVQRVLAAAGGNASSVRKLFFNGGSDAHGDLNFKRYNRFGIGAVSVNDDALGKMHTALLMPGGLSESNALAAMRAGQMIVSDGPILRARIRKPDATFLEVGSRLTSPAGATLVLDGQSSAEFGAFDQVFAMRITATSVDTLALLASGTTFSTEFPLETFCSPSGGSFLVLEGHTTGGFRSVDNPFILGPATATDVSDSFGRSVTVGPNPVRLSLSIAAGEIPRSISVYTVDGHRLVEFQPTTAKSLLPTHQLAAGMYLVRVRLSDRTENRKVTIVR